MSGQYFSETEIDEILGAVEETMQNAAKLAKGNFDSDEEGDAPAMQGEQAAAPAPEMGAPAPEMGAPAPEMGAPAPAAPAPEMGQDPAAQEAAPEEGFGEDPAAQEQGFGEEQPQGEEALEGDQGEISDEELQQIYSSMDPSDLERHYMIIRSMLRDAYAKMEKKEESAESTNGEGQLEKSEYQEKISALEKSNKEMEKSLTAAIEAMSILTKPERKAVTSEVQVLGKSENDTAATKEGTVNYNELSKSELVGELNEKVRDPKLSKSDRDTINAFLLRDEGKEQVIKLLGSNK